MRLGKIAIRDLAKETLTLKTENRPRSISKISTPLQTATSTKTQTGQKLAVQLEVAL